MARLSLGRWTAFAAVVLLSGLSATGCTASEENGQTATSTTSTTSAQATATPPPGPAANPFLAAAVYGVTHMDPAQSDSFPYPAPRGTFTIDPRKMPRVPGGPVNIMTMASTSGDYMWVTSSSGVRYVDVRDGAFKEVAALDAPGTKPISSESLDRVLDTPFSGIGQVQTAVRDDWGVDWQRIANGVYGLVDKDNHMYYVTQNSEIVVFGLNNPDNPADGIQIVKRLDIKPWLGTTTAVGGIPESIVGVNMTYDGKLIVLSSNGVFALDRTLEGEPQEVRFAPDEVVSNSMSIDDRGGIYVASDRIMHKVVWTGSKLSADPADGAWSAPYDFGQEPPSVKFGVGTGSTPTLMGFGDDADQLVVITDGSDRMKLVAFWRNDIPQGFQQKPGTKSNRIADQIQVTAGLNPPPQFVQSEQSVVVSGDGAFVVNNIRPDGDKDRLVDVLAGGPVFDPPRGMQRFQWDSTAHAWRSVWERGDVVSTSMVPAESSTSNIVFVNGYTRADGWELTGLDWATGETVHRTIFGQGNLGNGAYAIVQFAPNGDLIFNSVGGPFRAHLAR